MNIKWLMKVDDLDDIELIRFGFRSVRANSVPLSVFTAAERKMSQQIDTLFTTTYGHYAELYKANLGTKSINKVLLKQLGFFGTSGWVRVKGILFTDCAITSLDFNADGEEMLY